MKENLEDYPLFFKPDGGLSFYYIEDMFCCHCGKKGIWGRRTRSGVDVDYFFICINCKCSFYSSKIDLIDLEMHTLNKEIFDGLVAKENPYKIYKSDISDSIKSLQLLEV